MKCYLLFYLLLLLHFSSHANSAMPGVWQAGANGRFTPLFQQDSIYFGKIKMQHEQILVNLYQGFAVVKGEYWMYNTTAQTISMHVAYPKQGYYSAPVVYNVAPSYIAALRVQVNNKPVPLMQSTDSATQNLQQSGSFFNQDDSGKWYLWQMDFAPQSITKITVYFITDNSNADVTSGYSHRKGDAFTYVLESGRAWGGSIDSGKICIQLKGNFTAKDITGVLPDSTVYGTNDKLLYSFVNTEPMPSDNLLLFCKDSPANFDFKNEVLSKADSYFKEIDSFKTSSFTHDNMQLIHKSDMWPDTSGIGPFGWILIGIGFGVLLIVALIIWLIVLAVKGASNRKKGGR